MKKSFGADWDNRKKDLVFFSAVAFVILSAILVNYLSRAAHGDEYETQQSFSSFVAELKADHIKGVKLAFGSNNNDKLLVTPKVGRKYSVNYPLFETNVTTQMLDKGVEFEVMPGVSPATFLSSLIQISSLLMFVGILYFISKSTGMFGKAKFSHFDGSKDDVKRFDDVAGVDEAKANLADLVAYLRDPASFATMGTRMPKGYLFYGEPGTGKTLLARAVAGEAGVPFLWMTGSDFVEMFVGVGARSVKSLFSTARKRSPCIVFIDEIDSVGRVRGGSNIDSAAVERDTTLTKLLTEMDGFGGETGIVVIAATNKPEILDPGLVRTGRFDRMVYVGKPDVTGREEILRIHGKGRVLEEGFDFGAVARSTFGFTGADLENLLNQAGFVAKRRNRQFISAADVKEAKEVVMHGEERRSFFDSMSEKARRLTAVHECGHAVVAFHLIKDDKLESVSIVPRARTLGLTQLTQTEERYVKDKKSLEDELASLMGGRVAERLLMHTVTSGAAHDLAVATGLARDMVCRWGMSDLGAISIDGDMGGGMRYRPYAEQTLRDADIEVKKILDSAEERAEKCVEKYRAHVESLVDEVMKKETLSAAEIAAVLSDQTTPVCRGVLMQSVAANVNP